MLKKYVLGSFNPNNSEICRPSFGDIFMGTLDTYMKKINPPSAVLGGGAWYGLQAHNLLQSTMYVTSEIVLFVQDNRL